MRQSLYNFSNLLTQREKISREVILFFSLSFMVHFLFFTILIFMPSFAPKQRISPSVITVSMVTFPESESKGSRKAKKTEIQILKPKPEAKQKKAKPKLKAPERIVKKPTVLPAPVKPIEKAVSLAPKKKKKFKHKTSLKRRTYKPANIVKIAIRDIEKNIEKSRPKEIVDAISRLKKKLGKDGSFENLFSKKQMDSTNRWQQGAMKKKALTHLDIYRTEVAYYIQKNWAFSELLANRQHELKSVLVVKIKRSGEIADISFEKKSGNSYFDKSVYLAVKKSDPLPPLPSGYLKSIYTLGLKFTPQGIK